VEHYQMAFPANDHVVRAGHRIMVQVQSSWFPVIDRNPQTFVPNIFLAQASDFSCGHPARVPLGLPGVVHRASDRDRERPFALKVRLGTMRDVGRVE
jgi:predicted acyl esterase